MNIEKNKNQPQQAPHTSPFGGQGARLLVLDNYDSFTYNLVHLLRELGHENNMDIYRNDAITVKEVAKYDKILLSPGPGLPKDAGIMPELIKTYAKEKSILGVCLGHQAIAENFGAELYNMPEVLHGIASNITLNDEDALFNEIPNGFKACRYHSWSVKADSIPDDLSITAIDEQGEVMAIAHKQFDLGGVQFHPESILTEHGIKMMENWLAH